MAWVVGETDPAAPKRSFVISAAGRVPVHTTLRVLDFDSAVIIEIEADGELSAPRADELVTFRSPGDNEIGPYVVHNVSHTYVCGKGGKWSRVVELIVEPPRTFPTEAVRPS